MDVHSGEVSNEMGPQADIAGTPGEAQLTRDSQAVDGQRDEQEDVSKSGRPKRLRQAPKWFTYHSPREPTYVRQVKFDPYVGIQQGGIPTLPAPYIPEFPLNQYCTLPPAFNYIPPPEPPRF